MLNKPARIFESCESSWQITSERSMLDSAPTVNHGIHGSRSTEGERIMRKQETHRILWL
jgi:hypothetical protein